MVTVKEKFGFLPLSIWRLGKDKFLKEMVLDPRRFIYEDGTPCSRREIRGRLMSKTVKRGADSKGIMRILRLSEFNPSVAERCIKFWSNEGETVYDPFLNRGSIIFVARHLGRNGVATDIVPKYVRRARERNEEILSQYYGLVAREDLPSIEIHNCDATDVSGLLKDESVDYILSSPPFHQTERYESVDGQMSDVEDYEEFLEIYRKCIAEWFRVLKPTRYVTMVVNDWRAKKTLVPFHVHNIQLFLDAGFYYHDCVINELFTYTRAGVVNYAPKRFTAKIHEYVLTFKTPPLKWEEDEDLKWDADEKPVRVDVDEFAEVF